MKVKSLVGSLFKKDTEINKKALDSLETDQKEMIQGIVELSDTTVKEVMVPRIDTVFIPINAEREEILSRIIDSGHSRFPVYEETIDKVLGILYAKDVLRYLVREAGNEAPCTKLDLRKIIRRAFFVPESKHINELLKELRGRKVHIAVVVDEYGGVSGIVSMENIIEEIIGDIQDEFDNEKEDALELGGGAWLCDARINLEDLSELLGVDFPSDNFDTLGGFVFDLFGKIPAKYEKTMWEGHEFIIQGLEGHKINSVKIILGKGE